jgi:hypothetical protein
VLDVDFETSPPGEESFTLFFNFLRQEKKYASTTMWTYYSCLNSMMKRKYNIKLQELPRLTMLIKRFDTDIKSKVPIFKETQLKAFMLRNMESSYWLVRQSIFIVKIMRGQPDPDDISSLLGEIERIKVNTGLLELLKDPAFNALFNPTLAFIGWWRPDSL